jgi:4-hydroxythreonine-4-phosphate dehydrogenase
VSPRCLRVAVTPGEPAGIGPELIARIAQNEFAAQLVVIADPNLLRRAATRIGVDLRVLDWHDDIEFVAGSGEVYCLPVSMAQTEAPGELNANNADYVIQTLELGARGCMAGRFDALVTGPVQKSVLSRPGSVFVGHTEYFQQLSNTAHVVMLLATNDLRVALATTHLPLRDVANAINVDMLDRCLRIVREQMRLLYKLDVPRISVLGLNPHAGEDGLLGQEEKVIIEPLLAKLRSETNDWQLRGPLAADTAFSPFLRAETDVYLAMYHDQGLPVLKTLGFGSAVNVTLGLPFIRTSVDHGTALTLAGSGKADSGSLVAAISEAIRLAGTAIKEIRT